MAVRMLTSMAGDTFSIAPGEIFEGDAAHEARLIAAGFAEAIETKAAPKAAPQQPKGK